MRKRRLVLIAAALIVLLGSNISAQDAAGERFALIIGNSDYADLGSLENPRNDAEDMADVLEAMGFSVDRVINADLIQMEEAVAQFKNRLSNDSDSIGLFYYAGHGVQSAGQNYLIPSQARIPTESYLKHRGFSV